MAKLAGMPEELLQKAEEILNFYESDSKSKKKSKIDDDSIQLAMNFEEKKTDPFKEKLDKIDPMHLTPIEALNVLYELKMLKTDSK